jgi:hypothetical protein
MFRATEGNAERKCHVCNIKENKYLSLSQNLSLGVCA